MLYWLYRLRNVQGGKIGFQVRICSVYPRFAFHRYFSSLIWCVLKKSFWITSPMPKNAAIRVGSNVNVAWCRWRQKGAWQVISTVHFPIPRPNFSHALVASIMTSSTTVTSIGESDHYFTIVVIALCLLLRLGVNFSKYKSWIISLAKWRRVHAILFSWDVTENGKLDSKLKNGVLWR